MWRPSRRHCRSTRAWRAFTTPASPATPNTSWRPGPSPRGTGCLLGLELVDAAVVPAFVDHLELIQFAANIGDTRTLVAHPATMTHCRLDAERLAAAGISPALLRLSVGLEDPADLLADLTRALDAAHLEHAERVHTAASARVEVSA
ncbi:MAG: PLP-dependent transferase [Galactobacter sp.]